MVDLFQPSQLFLFAIFFKTTVYIPLCTSLGLLMSIFSKGQPRFASIIATSVSIILFIRTNPILPQSKSSDFLLFFETLSNLAHGWFIPFFISFLFFVRTVLYKFSNPILESLHLSLVGLALFLLFLTL